MDFPNSKELHEKDNTELLTILQQLKDRKIILETQRHQYASSGGFRAVGDLQNTNKTIARIQTILHLRQMPKGG